MNEIKVFYHSSFDDPKEHEKIMAEMPDFEKYLKDKEKIKKINMEKISPEMLPCYESPLLTKEQEQHLFRKMNYLKYKASKFNGKSSPVFQILIKNFLKDAELIRNFIAECNFRLSAQVLRGQLSFYRERSLVEGLLSDAYFDVLKSVDYFDWTLGHKFSTYATWVVKKNFYRDSKQKITQAEKINYLDENRADSLESRGVEYDQEQNNEYQQNKIKKLMGLADNENTDRKRQMYVIENYFGLNGKEKMTLEKISQEMKVTKERVRQLKEKGLKWLKMKSNGDDFW